MGLTRDIVDELNGALLPVDRDVGRPDCVQGSLDEQPEVDRVVGIGLE